MRVPRAASASGAMVKDPLPSESQRQPSASSARRVTTSTRLATMKAE